MNSKIVESKAQALQRKLGSSQQRTSEREVGRLRMSLETLDGDSFQASGSLRYDNYLALQRRIPAIAKVSGVLVMMFRKVPQLKGVVPAVRSPISASSHECMNRNKLLW